MLLQTLVQLNILILAAPALAGWNLLPLTSHGAVRAACVAWQYQGPEVAAPRTEQAGGHRASAERPSPHSLPLSTAPARVSPCPDRALACSALPPTPPAPGSPFPYAARAP